MWLSFDNHPAIAHLSADDRERLANDALRRFRREPSLWIEGAAASLLSLVGCVLVILQVTDRGQVFSWTLLAAPALISAMAFWWFSRVRHRFALALRQLLLEEGIRPRICLECGHALRGVRGADCPACGAPLTADETIMRS